MANQLARLFLRGSLMNETAKLVSPEDMKKVDSLMKEAWNDPELQGQKREFCMALSRTIGNEYKSIDAGMQDCQITFWKASLLVLFHESKQCVNKNCREHYTTTQSKLEKCEKCGGDLVLKWTPKPQIAEDPIKRRKFFKAVMFNYLRQIFRENKPPTMKETRIEGGLAPDVAQRIVKAILEKIREFNYEIDKVDDDHYTINCETGLIPLKLLQQINDVRTDFEQHGVQITLDWKTITIISLLEVPPTISCKITDKIYAKFTSFDGNSGEDSEGGFRDHCEHKVLTRMSKVQQDPMEFSEALDVIRSRLPDDAQELFDVITNTPQDYTEKFGTDRFYRSHLAQYLGKEPKEIDSMKEVIKIHCLSMQLGIER
jgi:hypothetical protein